MLHSRRTGLLYLEQHPAKGLSAKSSRSHDLSTMFSSCRLGREELRYFLNVSPGSFILPEKQAKLTLLMAHCPQILDGSHHYQTLVSHWLGFLVGIVEFPSLVDVWAEL